MTAPECRTSLPVLALLIARSRTMDELLEHRWALFLRTPIGGGRWPALTACFDAVHERQRVLEQAAKP